MISILKVTGPKSGGHRALGLHNYPKGTKWLTWENFQKCSFRWAGEKKNYHKINIKLMPDVLLWYGALTKNS